MNSVGAKLNSMKSRAIEITAHKRAGENEFIRYRSDGSAVHIQLQYCSTCTTLMSSNYDPAHAKRTDAASTATS